VDIFTALGTSGCNLNVNGGVYKNGEAYNIQKKIEVARKYGSMKEESFGPVSGRSLAKEAGVSPTFALKIISEVESGKILDPSKMVPNRRRGIGSLTFTEIDEAVLLALRDENPCRLLDGYSRELYRYTGTVASESLICDWFLHRFPCSGGLRKTSMVPIDKFSQDNIQRTHDFVEMIRQVSPERVKFGDEKHLKGSELFTRLVRRCPITGVKEDIVVDSDFRNTYSIIGFCGIDLFTVPFDYYINRELNDAQAFCEAVESSVMKGFLKMWDILVLDNASIHRFREAASLEDWLWDNFRIMLVFLPTRSPEFNPIELSWQTLSKGLKKWDLSQPRLHSDAVAYAAAEIMESFTHHDIAANYHHCGYIS